MGWGWGLVVAKGGRDKSVRDKTVRDKSMRDWSASY